MMLHQDGSPYRWIPDLEARFDLIITMDDASCGAVVPRPVSARCETRSARHQALTKAGDLARL
jgi:hypothetical protein